MEFLALLSVEIPVKNKLQSFCTFQMISMLTTAIFMKVYNQK